MKNDLSKKCRDESPTRRFCVFVCDAIVLAYNAIVISYIFLNAEKTMINW